MTRFFSELSYNGTNYHGWQRQPNGNSVQETIETTMETILGAPVELVGCGRTDAGVHASQYFMHFDFEGKFPEGFVGRLNKLLPADVAIRRIFEVEPGSHARFDAVQRSYEYRLVFVKNPFETNTAWHFPFHEKLAQTAVREVAALLLEYRDFAPFCKTHTDAKTMQCDLRRSEWVIGDGCMTYHVTANRFLRGMVRLIVGACLNAGLGKITPADVRRAMDTQAILKKSYSVPPHGLFLTEVKYPYL